MGFCQASRIPILGQSGAEVGLHNIKATVGGEPIFEEDRGESLSSWSFVGCFVGYGRHAFDDGDVLSFDERPLPTRGSRVLSQEGSLAGRASKAVKGLPLPCLANKVVKERSTKDIRN